MNYLSYIRELPCVVCNMFLNGELKSDAHHIKAIGMGRNRKKMSENQHIEHGVVPLCRLHHQEFHNIGITEFEKKNNINLWKDCYRLLVKWMQNK